MASPAKIAEILPDTLPEDFGEWDGGESPAGQPGSAAGNEAGPGLTVVAKPAETPAAATPSGNLLRGGPLPTPAKDFADDGAFLHRVRSLSPKVDRAPDVVAPRHTAAIDEVRFSAPKLSSTPTVVRKPALAPAPAPQPQPAVAVAEPEQKLPAAQATAISAADEVLFQSFRSSHVDTAKQPQTAKKKRPMIAAISGASAVVLALAIMISLMHHSNAALKSQVAEPQPVITVEQPEDYQAKPSPATATPSTPSKPQASNSDDAQDDADAQSQADSQQISGPSEAQSQMMSDQLNAPARIQRGTVAVNPEAPPPNSFNVTGMDASGNGNTIGTVFGSQKGPKVQVAAPKVVNVSAGVAVGLLIQKTPPVYPQIAKAARVSGTVVLAASISKTGTIENLHVLSGPVMLREAAVDSVKSWHYRPYKLNNEPVEIETTINVVFSLGG